MVAVLTNNNYLLIITKFLSLLNQNKENFIEDDSQAQISMRHSVLLKMKSIQQNLFERVECDRVEWL